MSVSAQVINTNYIKVTVQAGDLTHYYMARNGYPHIYMATHFTTEPSVHGHVRYILRMSRSLLPYGPEPSDISQTVSTVEAGDIFALSNGETRSKHYSNMRIKDWRFIGATDQEITYIVNYAQAQTEAYRTGILNHYTLMVTSGEDPSTPDTSWFSNMGLTGYVADSGRGRVAGVGISGRDTNFDYTVGFANSTAQYWADANPSSGYFSSDDMLPGTYTMTTYKNELAVDTRSVSVQADQVTILNSFSINNDPQNTSSIWRIGNWDGTPNEFLNGDKLTTMHPSDVRMSNWDPSNFIIGYTDTSSFPAYMWKDINNDHIIYFKLSSSQLAQAHQLRIGITCAFANGRPTITVNNWSSAFPSPSSQPSTRNLTTGSYRCNNTTFTYDIPASAWQTSSSAWNILTVSVISGTSTTGYLSPSISIDAIDLLD